RHTRWPRDWSSDVCSSDLADLSCAGLKLATELFRERSLLSSTPKGLTIKLNRIVNWLPLPSAPCSSKKYGSFLGLPAASTFSARSEERRVGKECRSGW